MTAFPKQTTGSTADVQTNGDTGLIKLVAFITMAIDHIGYVFFPGEMWMRIIGRIAFPLFAYCLATGCIYTKNPKKYALRLFAFSVVSQPFYSLAFFPYYTEQLFDPINYGTAEAAIINIAENLHLNIGFTMLLGFCAIQAIKSKKWLAFATALAVSLWDGFEYSLYGVALILLMYIFCTKDAEIFGVVIGIALCIAFFDTPNYTFMGISLDAQGFGVLALPFMLMHTKSGVKIPKLIGYGFYPLHIFIIYLAKLFI